MIVLGISVFDALINGAHEIYLNLDVSKDRSIKGFIQIIKLVLYFIGGILILSVIFNKNPLYFLTGLSAMAAVLLLVFKDTILGFVASIQLTANNMVKLGDWITMPSHGADGDVIEITLNTVKVRNFDKTISTIPTYALVSESFSNWRGMKESGGRRIKRALHINVKSICFCTEEMLEKYEKIKLIADYIRQKRVEIEEDNKAKNLQKGDMLNGRRLTNIGVFRKYIESYIRNHPKIHGEGSSFIAMVRQLQQTEKGLPLEIYAFSKEQNWAVYEGIQADVFDHLMAVIPQFDLSLFQNPSGDDFRNLINSPNS
jgi:miniconductance mechanosensitive channel